MVFMIPTPPEMAHRLPSQQDLSASGRAEVEKGWGDTWPGDRVPTSTDAEIAYQPLDPGQVSVFRQAMLADRQAREKKRFPSLDNADTLFSMPNSSQALAWPTSFFLASLKAEYRIGIDELIQQTHQNLLCTTIFLRDVPPIGFLRVPRPEYLTLALAAVGASMTPQKEEQALQLWHTSASQLLGNLEVDNGVARKTDLVKAWTLLETFAFLSSDRIVRRRARMIHGCVKTVEFSPSFDRRPNYQQSLGSLEDFSRSILP
ncbi:hypothetical protein TsFJ059_008693 [Trichoderma semiorbis]|uniref:Uncharacterized protein n=1 Tax=Trichoderma semiorbis TaxID=1491008 RepID=A0A9P8HJQ7_9HYPO|nr:hypothetical protein TsFJ059_008693 [Trichoderma semiorbis]